MPAIDARRRPRRATLAFAGLVIVTFALLWLQLAWGRCHGGDAAGCGMSRGYAALMTYAAALLVALAALLFLVPRRWAHIVAWCVVVPVGSTAAVATAATISHNLKVTGTVDGVDPATLVPRPDEGLRIAVRCYLAARMRRADDAAGARALDDMAQYYSGQVQLLRHDVDPPRLTAITRDEAATLRTKGEPDEAIGRCADLQIGTSDMVEAMLDAAGLDASDLRRQRDRAYAVRDNAIDPVDQRGR